MRVAIATFYQAVNAGAYLQQFALRRVLEQRGFEVEILRYRSTFGLHEFRSRFHRYSGLKRITSLAEVTRFWRKTHRDFRYSRVVASGEKFDLSRYAAVVFGSDEIWNIGSWFSGYCPILFGKGIEGTRKISYAPSFGEISEPAQLPAEVAGLLRSFHSLSVRDENSVQMIRALTSREPHLSLDPALIYDYAEELRQRPAKRPGALIVYATKVAASDREAILIYARRANLPIVALGFAQDWVDSTLVDAHPLQMLAEFRSSHAIFTNTYHGTALAAKFGRPFVLGDLCGKHNKVSSLLKLLNLTPVRPESPAEWTAGFTKEPPPDLGTSLSRERARSREYLQTALAGLA